MEPCCAMLMAWDGFVANLKGYFRSEFGLKFAFTGIAKMIPATLRHAIACIGNSVALGVLQLRMTISFLSELRFVHSWTL